MFEFDADFYNSKAHVQFQLGLETIKELNIQNGENILDIGCGTGRLTIEIAKKTLNGLVIALDVNPKMISKAKENLKKSGLTNIQFFSANILHFEPKNQFDAVFSNSALHWVQETRALYQKIYDILIPGGRCVAQIPTKGSLDQFIPTFLAPIQPLNLDTYFKEWKYPVKLIGTTALKKIFNSIGFLDIKVWIKTQNLTFKSPEDLLDFLQSAALVPFLSQIPPEKRELYLNYILNLLKTQETNTLCATMKRLFLNIKKGV
ncbi:MAG TPA: methyltransferase domain-containing protein [Candidatus Deferrimicrobium sp.]|nr:methyltransferase domain-containing protein [Candidatus Deferrimicrobium sp.]